MNIIYKKSLKGVEEVALRSNGLQLRLRAYLILVDGTKSDNEIQYLNPGLPEVLMVLAALHGEGYLEVTEKTATPLSPAQAKAAESFARVETPPPAPPHQAYKSAESFVAAANLNALADNTKFVQARESMTREVMMLLGKDAEMVVTKISRCETPMDLFAMMMGLKKIITIYNSAAKAEEFSNKFSYISTL